MKKHLVNGILCSAVAVICCSCAEEMRTPVTESEGITIELISDEKPQTKTAMNADGTNVEWTGLEKVHCYLDGVFYSSKGNDNVVATKTDQGLLKVTLNHLTQETAPKNTIGGFVGAKADLTTMPEKYFAMELPSRQFPTDSTFDSTADHLVMENVDVSSYDFTQPVSLQGITYNRLNAITKIVPNFEGLTVPDKSESIYKIEFSTSLTSIAGTFYYDPAQKFVDENGIPINGSQFVTNPSKTITLDLYQNPVKIGAKRKAPTWMVLPAIELPQQDITVKITTLEHLITKTMAMNQSAKFDNTMLNILELPMSGATADPLTTYEVVNKKISKQSYYLSSHEGKIFNGEVARNGLGLGTQVAVGEKLASGFQSTDPQISFNKQSDGTYHLALPNNIFLGVEVRKNATEPTFFSAEREKNAANWTVTVTDGIVTISTTVNSKPYVLVSGSKHISLVPLDTTTTAGNLKLIKAAVSTPAQ